MGGGRGRRSEHQAVQALHLPYFGIGFKSYVWGKEALKLAEVAREVSLAADIPIYVTPQLVDIAPIAREVGLPVLAPCIDPLRPGRGQGQVLPEAVREAGAVGAVINHMERRLSLADTYAAIRRAQEVGLISLVCADTPEEARAVATMGPDAVIPESPRLIGSLKSVTEHEKAFFIRAVEMVKAVNPEIAVICGGGISSAEDVAEAVRMGADGAGASRAICEAEDPGKLLKEMVQALKREWKNRAILLQ